ncbi:hypothetical protein ACR6C2_00470 [Streptomyces sp. INA 01156]
MVSKTDNELAPMIYRYYRTLQSRVAGSEDDLDRRFDNIIDGIEQQKNKALEASARKLLAFPSA